MRRTSVLVVILALVIGAKAAFALDFSADMVSTAEGQSFRGKIFVSGDKVRMEMAGATTITRMDKNVAWMIMPGQDMYMEQPFEPEKVAGATEKMPGEIERALIGPDTVDDKTVDKYRIVYTSREGRAVVFQWVDRGSNIPIKTASEDGSWAMEYRGLVVGAQPDDLFEIPAGYKKFAIPNMSDMMRPGQGTE